jgi:hypothetical protein
MYPEIQEAYDDFIPFRERYYDVGKNSIQLPTSHEPLEVLHHQLVIKMSTLSSPQNAPAAPKRPTIYAIAIPEYANNMKWTCRYGFESFCHEENGLLYLLEAIYLDIQSSGYDALTNVPNLRADIVKAFDLALERLTQKLEDLTTMYKASNVAIEDALVLMAMYLNKLNFHTYADVEEPSTSKLKKAAHSCF